jgi:hypothetical protein
VDLPWRGNRLVALSVTPEIGPAHSLSIDHQFQRFVPFWKQSDRIDRKPWSSGADSADPRFDELALPIDDRSGNVLVHGQ